MANLERASSERVNRIERDLRGLAMGADPILMPRAKASLRDIEREQRRRDY